MPMNELLYETMLELAADDLIPRLLAELEESKKLRACPSYAEVSDFCRALNLVALWAGMPKMTPKALVERHCQK